MQVFAKLREDKTDTVFENVKIVAGDVGEENLGLSEIDRLEIIQNVTIIYHCAASLDFEADLPSNVNINLLGTRRILELCSQLKQCLVTRISSSRTIRSMLSRKSKY